MSPSKFKDTTSLVIMRAGVEAGTLKRTRDGCVFKFNQQFLESKKFKGLSFRMRKTNTEFLVQGTNLHPFFAGLLPEGLRLKALVGQLKTSQDDLFSLFAAVGSHVIGDVQVQQRLTDRNKIQPPKLKEVDFDLYLEKILKMNSYAGGEDAISGVQEKISASMIHFPLNIAGQQTMSLVKLNPPDKQNLVENEFFCMKLAEKCGITVPKVKFVKDGKGKLGLLVERFDRVWDGQKRTFKMLHQEDACQFLDLYPSDKYRVPFADIAKEIKNLVPAASVTLLKLLRIYSYSYLIGNGDLHAKNISLLVSERGFIDLSPAYDLICTSIYGDVKMALKFDGKDDNLKRKSIIQFGERLGIPSLAIEKMLDQLLADFEKYNALLGRIPMEAKTRKIFWTLVKKRTRDLATT